MGAAHPHLHGSTRGARNSRRLAITLALIVTYMIAEFLGALISNSLALLADAVHMLSDAGALGLALFAIWFARRPASPRHTWGYYRTEILAALVNAATLIAIAIFILIEAYRRFRSPPEVEGGLMMAVAAGGLLINLSGLAILRGGREESLNVKGAWLHLFTDTLGSIQAIVAGALILFLGWNWVDPLASVLIGILVVFSAWTLLRESVAVLMESAPRNIDPDEVRAAMRSVATVEAVHDLHIWTITSGMVALSAHITATGSRPAGSLLRELRDLLHDRFDIDHITIQIEPEEFEERGVCI